MKSFGPAIGAALIFGLCAKPVLADSLIVNGDFSEGNIGFSTDYTTLAVPDTHTNPPSYNTVQNPGMAFTNGYASYTDHTGDSAGLMLFVDGASDLRFWYESVSLADDTTYVFTFWATAAFPDSPADLQFSVNGTSEDTGHQLTTIGQWVEYTDTFTTGSAGDYTLSMADLNGVVDGNDFTVDDIALNASAAPLPATLPLFAGGLGMVGFFARRKKQKALAAA
jgi:hypothetical protein